MRAIRRFSVLVVILGLLPTGMEAQEAGPCDYARCALRLEKPGWFTTTKVVRGVAGKPVASVGLFGTDLDSLLQASDSALAYARRFNRNQRTGHLATLASVLAYVGGFALARNSSDHDTAALVLVGSGAALTVYGAMEFRSAGNALSRAIWWHNERFARRPAPGGDPDR